MSETHSVSELYQVISKVTGSHYMYDVNSIFAAWSMFLTYLYSSVFLFNISGIHTLIINMIYA